MIASEQALSLNDKNHQIKTELMLLKAIKRLLEYAGVAVGMGMSCMEEIVDAGQDFREKGFKRVKPFFIPKILINMAAGQISMKFGLKVINVFLSVCCHSVFCVTFLGS